MNMQWLIPALCSVLIVMPSSLASHSAGTAASRPAPPPSTVDLGTCMDDINDDCEIILGAWIMYEEVEPPSVSCCQKLLQMGKSCHEKFLQSVIDTKDVNGTGADARRRSSEIWNFCGREKGIHPDPVATAPVLSPSGAPIDLDACTNVMTDDCEIIVMSWLMFDEMEPPSVGCCKQMVSMKRPCHNAYVQTLINIKKIKGTAKDAWKRSRELLDFCGAEGEAYASAQAPAPAPL